MTRTRTLIAAVFVAAVMTVAPSGQVGQGIQDLNAIPEATLAALPNMTPAIAKALVAARPFQSIVEANTFLLGQKLTQEQITAIYDRAFVHLNLNTATAPEILLVPRIARRMTIEFEEYRPWINFAQFDREIGKYVDATEVARLKQYLFIPMDLNKATDDQFRTIPQLPGNMIREFNEYKPWKAKAQFDREISKYVGDKETARLWRFLTIEP